MLYYQRLLIYFVYFYYKIGYDLFAFYERNFQNCPLTLNELGICVGASIIVFHAVELEKFIKRFVIKKTFSDK